ncbi:hypothetical protein GDO78_012147 [Eleutherodactylus coqui]|uniref:Uncharacterized protein n=1 Tax=Eleutherodactylus coqui TaxID=57060 RepID=A0A8J6F549_ELECQ|nr:hypothetical protein GDO78_012147 [Eleutherodactylus coqui]
MLPSVRVRVHSAPSKQGYINRMAANPTFIASTLQTNPKPKVAFTDPGNAGQAMRRGLQKSPLCGKFLQ